MEQNIIEEEIMVSIDCITYNQEEYIAQAIESFLMQKTNFKFEILIHDDASTDRTPEIIREYEKKYPQIIKPIYQTENKYSKGIRVGYEYNLKRARGKYIALCEGDDYWTDEHKLQKQVDYMEENKDCTICVHRVQLIDGKTGEKTGEVRPYNRNTTCNTEEFIVGGGGFVGTNSILFPKKYFQNPPEWYLNAKMGDYTMQIYLPSQGYGYYMDYDMSAYRVNAKNSWSSRISSGGNEKYIKHYKYVIDLLNTINIDTNYKYDNAIKQAQLNYKFKIAIYKKQYNQLNKDDFKEIYSNLPLKSKIIIGVKKYIYLPKYIINKMKGNR